MTNNEDILEWIQQWYYKNCNGDWEHDENITITTIDNPGWSLTIKLEETYLENKMYKEIFNDKSQVDWYCCRVEHNKFLGDGGPLNLKDLLYAFREWAIYHKPS
jgi:hypothetical protein